jgi:hypothetical protein
MVREAVRDLDVEPLACGENGKSKLEDRDSAIGIEQSKIQNLKSKIADHRSQMENRQSVAAGPSPRFEFPVSNFGFPAPVWAACLLLVCQLSFPFLWRSLGTQSDRVGAAGAMPVAKSIGPGRPTLPLAVSTTPPAAKSTLVEHALSAGARKADSSLRSAPLRMTSPPGGSPAVIVVVKPHKTSHRICLEHFGRFDRELLKEIQALNPRITDPNCIETGQRIILPARTPTSPGTDSAGRAGAEPMNSVRN